MTYSFLSLGSEPSSLAITFREATARKAFFTENDALLFSDTGRKSRLRAARFKVSKLCPPAAQSFRALSRVIQPSIGTRARFRSGDCRSKFSRLLLPTTTNHGYPAGP